MAKRSVNKVSGLRLTQANLAAVEARMKLAAIPALEEVGKQAAEYMAQIVRKDTGKLAGSIVVTRVETNPRTGRASLRVGPSKATGWRARFLEFGTRHMSAFPFVRPTRSKIRPEVAPRVKRRLKGALK